MTLSDALFTTGNVEWETPAGLYAPLHAEFDFVLDAAATIGNRKCEEYLGPDHSDPARRDALVVPWHVWSGPRRVVWCNPPYGRDVGQWVEKAVIESCMGATVVMLLPVRTDTRWWFRYALDADEIRFLRGRLRFNAAGSAPFPSAVLIFRPPIEGLRRYAKVVWWDAGDFKVNRG